jgi:hypothetical protein
MEPASHIWHRVVGALLYVPGRHPEQVTAPLLTVPDPAFISVMDPALHTAHPTVDEAENIPELHGVHVVALVFTTPVPAPISAMEPAAHTLHTLAPLPGLKVPGGHNAHAITGDVLYCPGEHIVHVVAPVLTTPVPATNSAMDPAGHTAHFTFDAVPN